MPTAMARRSIDEQADTIETYESVRSRRPGAREQSRHPGTPTNDPGARIAARTGSPSEVPGGSRGIALTDAHKEQLREAVAAGASISGSLMNVIGLDEVRARFPELWERNRERILATTRGILKQFTDPRTDIVLPVGDGNFILLFTRLDKAGALLRSAAIKAEVLRRFMGDDVLDTLDVRVQAIEVDSGNALEGTLGELLASACPADKAAFGAPPVAPVEDPSAEAAGRANSGLAVHELTDDRTQFDELLTRFQFSFDAVEFGFRPFLFAKRGACSVFQCTSVRYAATGEILTGYAVLPREVEAEQVVKLDMKVLAHMRQGLVEMAARKRSAIAIVPVAFETMTNRQAAMDYLECLRQVPSDLRNYMVSMLCRCPEGVPEGRLAELVNPLKRLTRTVCMRLESARQPLAAIKTAGAGSVCLDLSEVAGTEMASDGFIRRYAATARKLGLRSFIDGVDTPEQARRCRAARIEYLGGRMVAELSDYVGPIAPRRSAA